MRRNEKGTFLLALSLDPLSRQAWHQLNLLASKKRKTDVKYGLKNNASRSRLL